MSNDIKEIINKIDIASEIFDLLLEPEECTLLYKYITNLQNEQLNLKSELASMWEYKAKYETLHSIIKEVRELINYYGVTPDQNDDSISRSILKHFLEILDKGE